MPRVPKPRRFIGILLALALLATTIAPVAAWNNGGDDPGYGTHDWVIDAALRVLDGRANGWFNASTARLHSDDPDNAGSTGENDHVYRDTGIRGGAIHRVAEHYAAAVRHHKAANYAAASREIGLMAHYYSDVWRSGSPSTSGRASGSKAPDRGWHNRSRVGSSGRSSRISPT